MKLIREEIEMLEGKQGVACQKAMELIVKYGEALGAERLIDTNNVAVCIVPGMETFRIISPSMDIDEYVSKVFLGCEEETVAVDKIKAFTTTTATFRDYDYPELQKGGQETCDMVKRFEDYCRRIGMVILNSCAPYQSGNIPTKGESCAWVESSAIAYCNSVLGGRTNIEGPQSAFASAVTGKTPYWGMHLDENRKGRVIVRVDTEMKDVTDWGLLGYFAGPRVGLDIPIYTNIKEKPDLFMLMSIGAAGISSGSIVMFHIPGITPEAVTLDIASGGAKNLKEISFGKKEKKETYEKLNQSAKDDVDVVVLGCPHYTLERIAAVSNILDGKKLSINTELFITVGRAQKAIADRMGYTDIIKRAGGVIMEDTCGTHLAIDPSKSVASDSAKILHYIPRMSGVANTFLGSMEECIESAIAGKWKGRGIK